MPGRIDPSHLVRTGRLTAILVWSWAAAADPGLLVATGAADAPSGLELRLDAEASGVSDGDGPVSPATALPLREWELLWSLGALVALICLSLRLRRETAARQRAESALRSREVAPPSGPDRALVAPRERAAGPIPGARRLGADEGDVTGRGRSEEIFLEIAQGVAGVTGEAFFSSLAGKLARTVAADAALAAELDAGGRRARILAAWLDGRPVPAFDFELHGAAASSLAAQGACLVRERAREQFPLDPLLARWEIEGCAAIALKDGAGEMLGFLAVMRRSPLEEELLVRSVLEIFAARAAAEIERLRAERVLRESEARYRAYVQASPFALLAADASGRCIDANAEACRLTGYSRDELAGMTVPDFVAPENRSEAEQSFQNLLARGISSSERWILRKDGQRRLCAIQGVRLSADLLLGFFQDITERVQAEAAERARLDRARRRHEVLFRLATGSLAGSDLRSAAERVTAAAAGVVDTARVGVWLEDGDGGLVCADLYNSASGRHSGGAGLSRERCGHYLACLETARAIDVADAFNDPRTAELLPYCSEYGVCSILDAPIWIAGKLAGSVRFERTGSPAPWPPDDIAFAAELADRVVETLANDARRLAEIALRESEERYRRLFESAGDAIVLLREGIHVDCNAKALELYGCRREEIVGTHARRFWPLFQPDGSDSWEAAVSKAGEVAARGAVRYEWRVCRFNGDPLDVEVTLNSLEIRGCPHLLAIVKDITGRKRSQELLHLQSEALEQSVDGIAVIGLDGHIRFSNRSFARLHGYEREEVIGAPVSTFVSGWSAPDLAAWVLEVCRLGRCEETGLRRRRDGGAFLARVTDSVLADESGRTAGVIKVVRDVTEAARLEEQLRHSQKMEAVGRLAGGVAHDFNNILTVIRGHAELLLQELPRSDDLLEGVEEIQKAALRASELTQQLLAFSRKQIVQTDVLDLNALIEDLAGMLRRLIGDGIELETVLAPGLWSVLADRGQMHQVVMNLVVNARDALSGRGRIELRTSNLHLGEDPRAPAGLSPGEYVCLSVSDDGIGMDSETRERIFEPFFTTKPDGAGTGLGLATLYGIVQQCGGGVVVDSEPGHGATFHVYLPRTRSAPRLKPAPGPPPAAGSETIVLVEDQDDVRAFVSRLLRRAGYQVIEAANGFEAIERSAGVRIHLVLADVMMPQMTGFELAHRLRESNPRLPMLFMSGYAQEGAAASEALRKLGAAYLQKPFSPEILCAKIRALLDERTPGGLAV